MTGEIKKVIENLQKIQLDSGSKDTYGQGLYNGMELTKATLLKLEPCFLSKEEFQSDEHCFDKQRVMNAMKDVWQREFSPSFSEEMKGAQRFRELLTKELEGSK